MGMLMGGWAREEAEEELWYIKKYGLEAGQVAYQQYLKEQEAHRKWCQENPKVIRWSKSEPKVTESDIICRIQKEPFKVLEEMRVTKIDDEGQIWGRMITDKPMQDPRQGAEYMWEGEYAKLNY